MVVTKLRIKPFEAASSLSGLTASTVKIHEKSMLTQLQVVQLSAFCPECQFFLNQTLCDLLCFTIDQKSITHKTQSQKIDFICIILSSSRESCALFFYFLLLYILSHIKSHSSLNVWKKSMVYYYFEHFIYYILMQYREYSLMLIIVFYNRVFLK